MNNLLGLRCPPRLCQPLVCDGISVSCAGGEANGMPVVATQTVADGIGKVGKTAIIEISQEPHLHFEVSQDGKNIDPLKLYDK